MCAEAKKGYRNENTQVCVGWVVGSFIGGDQFLWRHCQLRVLFRGDIAAASIMDLFIFGLLQVQNLSGDRKQKYGMRQCRSVLFCVAE